MLGIATPSESTATGVVGAIFVAAIYRKLSIKMIFESLLSAASITYMFIDLFAVMMVAIPILKKIFLYFSIKVLACVLSCNAMP